ncbi:MAG: hypothetical protein RI973_631 [Bacteroidota bacterium]|jgi:hypothetical protein
MNLENFHKYLENPSLLYQISYQELKSLVLQYPYSPNLRYLLLIKSIQEKHKDQDRNLSMAAIAVPDRRKLWQLVKEFSRTAEQQEHYQLSEDFLELKDLSTLSFQLAEETDTSEQELAPRAQFMSASPDEAENEAEAPLAFPLDFTSSPGEESGFSDDLSDGEASSVPAHADFVFEFDNGAGSPEISLEAEIAENEPSMPEAEAQREKEDFEAGHGMEVPGPASEQVEASSGQMDAKEAEPMPIPKSSFRSWQHSTRLGLHPLDPHQLVAARRHKKEPAETVAENSQGHEAGEAQHLAEKSVRSDMGIASETLARVLELQRHFHKAIAMYEQLILQNPEKKAFFAAKIEELKSKM